MTLREEIIKNSNIKKNDSLSLAKKEIIANLKKLGWSRPDTVDYSTIEHFLSGDIAKDFELIGNKYFHESYLTSQSINRLRQKANAYEKVLKILKNAYSKEN